MQESYISHLAASPREKEQRERDTIAVVYKSSSSPRVHFDPRENY